MTRPVAALLGLLLFLFLAGITHLVMLERADAAVAVGPYRARESCRCTCNEVKP